MADIKGFRAFRYDPAVVDDFDNAITPPYDVITEDERQGLFAKGPHNFARLILPEPEDGLSTHDVAARELDAWIEQGVFKQDAEDSFYLLEQTFTGLEGKQHVRRGFFGVVRIPEEGERTILGHERTFQRKVEDRLDLTKATRTNLGAVFGMYSDPDNALADFYAQMDARPADIVAHTIDGVTQKIWAVPEDAAVIDFIAKQNLYIADGHHRFKTAGLYRDTKREASGSNDPQIYDHCLMGFVSFDDPGLFIYPPHRVVTMPENFDAADFFGKLGQWFDVQPVKGSLVDAVTAGSGCTMGVYIAGGGQHLLTLKDIDRVDMLGDDRGPAWRDLDVAILHRGILERILGFEEGAEHAYAKSVDIAYDMVDSGERGLAFILNGTRQDQIRACAEADEPMPQKSTYFFPKLPSGGVINRLV
jgi:uncharacterized protein (DUF1015 family)